MNTLAKITIDMARAGFGSIKDIDDTEFESLMEVWFYQEWSEMEDEVLQEIRRNRREGRNNAEA